MSIGRQAIMRASALLLLPLLLASSAVHGYSFAICRHDKQIHRRACCSKPSPEAPQGPTLTRGCCDLHTVQLEQLPASPSRRHDCGGDLPMAPLATLAAPLRPDLLRPAATAPLDVRARGSGPPIILLTRALLI